LILPIEKSRFTHPKPHFFSRWRHL